MNSTNITREEKLSTYKRREKLVHRIIGLETTLIKLDLANHGLNLRIRRNPLHGWSLSVIFEYIKRREKAMHYAEQFALADYRRRKREEK